MDTTTRKLSIDLNVHHAVDNPARIVDMREQSRPDGTTPSFMQLDIGSYGSAMITLFFPDRATLVDWLASAYIAATRLPVDLWHE